MLYKIINPSDPYTIEIPTLDVAVTIAVLLGRGKYAFEPFNGEVSVPFLWFKPDAWCQKEFQKDLMGVVNPVMEDKVEQVADALDSILIGGEPARKAFYEQVKGMDRAAFEKFRFEYHDARRSSENDIGGTAYRMATKFRESMKTEIQ